MSTKATRSNKAKAKPAAHQAQRSKKNQPLIIGGIMLVLVVVVAGIFLLGNNQTAAYPAEIGVAQAYQKY